MVLPENRPAPGRNTDDTVTAQQDGAVQAGKNKGSLCALVVYYTGKGNYSTKLPDRAAEVKWL